MGKFSLVARSNRGIFREASFEWRAEEEGEGKEECEERDHQKGKSFVHGQYTKWNYQRGRFPLVINLIYKYLDWSSEIHKILNHRELDFESSSIKQNFDWDHTFPIELAPKGILFGAKSIGKV